MWGLGGLLGWSVSGRNYHAKFMIKSYKRYPPKRVKKGVFCYKKRSIFGVDGQVFSIHEKNAKLGSPFLQKSAKRSIMR